MKCPICNGKLRALDSVRHVMDGNQVYQCNKDNKHRFWRHPFQFNIIHWNPKATETNWDTLQCWEIKNGKYKDVTKEYNKEKTKNTEEAKKSSENNININANRVVLKPFDIPKRTKRLQPIKFCNLKIFERIVAYGHTGNDPKI